MTSSQPIQSSGHPKLKAGQCAVKRTDAGDVVWLTFDSLQAACKYAASDITEHPSVEYAIYNSDEVHIQTFNQKAVDDIAADFIAAHVKGQKRWWEFWKL